MTLQRHTLDNICHHSYVMVDDAALILNKLLQAEVDDKLVELAARALAASQELCEALQQVHVSS